MTLTLPSGHVHTAPGLAEQWSWEGFDIAEADRRLAADHDEERGRYSEQRRGLYTDFAALPLPNEGLSRGALLAEYVEWCNAWGSPGFFGFLFSLEGHRRGRYYVREKRTGRLFTEDEFFERYPEAELGDERHREPVRAEWFSREIALMRATLLLCADREAEGPDEETLGRARNELARHLDWLPRQGLLGGHPDHRDGLYHASGEEELDHWLLLHAGGARLAPTYARRSASRDAVWVFDSFMDALYHLLLEDITGGQRIRRCADPKCGRLFRPRRDSIYHDERCRHRVDVERQASKLKLALTLRGEGRSVVEIAEKLGWSVDMTARKLSRAQKRAGGSP